MNLGCTGGGEVGGTAYSPKECFIKALEGTTSEKKNNVSCWAALSGFGGGEVDYNDQGTREYSMAECAVMALEIKGYLDEDEKYRGMAYNNLGVSGGGSVDG